MTDYAYLQLGSTKAYFPYNPNSTYWNYDLNRLVVDTYGGRVIQLLSVSTTSLMMIGDAGTRPKLLQFFSEFKNMQDLQIQQKSPAQLYIPATFAEQGSISQNVWLASMDVALTKTTVTYPYRLNLEIQDNFNSSVNNIIKDFASDFSNLSKDGVGFVDDGYYQGIKSGSTISIAQMSKYMYGK